MDEIVNRVTESGIKQINLEDFIPAGERRLFDIKSWLFEELILKEKDFREHIKLHDWSQYKEMYVAINCSADAIIPTWAFMLLTAALQPFAKFIFFGTLQQLDEQLILANISLIDAEQFRNQRVVIKGCGDKEIPVSAFVALTVKLKPVVKSIMYGEPCSTVPVYKSKI
jgi:S-adenosylmethionine/arginine decarboxylase-like enzyme